MQFNVVNWPQRRDVTDYQQAIERMRLRIEKLDGVVAIYQIGGLSAPGVSDIDMVVVWNDGAATDFQPLDGADRYLFTHTLFAVTETSFRESQPFNLFHNYKLLFGKEVSVPIETADSDRSLIKRQIALEYLVRMLVNNMVANHHRLLDVRSLLLQANAIRYDLDFLSVTSGSLFDSVSTIIDWRQSWVAANELPSSKEFVQWYREFDHGLECLVEQESKEFPIHLPDKPSFRMGRNIDIERSEHVARKATGLKVPGALVQHNRFAKRLNNRLAKFRLDLPWDSDRIPETVLEMFKLNQRMKAETTAQMPAFFPLTSSLHLS